MANNTRKYYTSEIVNTTEDKRPLTYFEWLEYETDFDRNDAFAEYSQYIKKWYTDRGHTTQVAQENYVKNLYINLLKQIAIDYTTSDEKRFLENA